MKRALFISLIFMVITFAGVTFAISKNQPKPEVKVPFQPSASNEQVKTIETDLGFHIHDRRSKISRFPCTSCHDKGQKVSIKTGTHSDIILDHSRQSTMSCKDCHLEEEPQYLKGLSGQKIALENAYQLCTTCHSTQAKDWRGGAHGKRISGWSEKRVIMSCTDCHNPHQPRFDKRMPILIPKYPEGLDH